ncbi:MAG: exodeoxyribonuclease VII large subunit [Muribaculaceae bacterium]
MANNPDSAMTLLELNEIIRDFVQNDATAGLWVTAETSDLSRKRHCYMELIQKDDSGNTVARARAAIWSNNLYDLDAKFSLATGQRLATGMKVLVRVTVSFHPVFGLLLVIDDIDPAFTIGDAVRRRQEAIARLTQEGIIDLNRTLGFIDPVLRIAVISAESAAGYGDFMNQLHGNSAKIKFYTRLFPAIMQGATAPKSIIAALCEIADNLNLYDAVVIIRGGGATDDLACFEDYDLAASVAQFPLPVIIGIGHERDITLLDFVAAMRVKTPTAAAEWLINRATGLLEQLQNIGNSIFATVTSLLADNDRSLANIEGQLPEIAKTALLRSDNYLNNAAISLSAISSTRIAPETAALDAKAAELASATLNAIDFASHRLDAFEQLVAALSPQAVLERGYTITTIGNKIIKKAADIIPGDTITTRFADGSIISKTI